MAEKDERLIGYVVILGGTSNRNRHSGYVVCGIIEEYRGQGVASKLFKESFRWAKEVGITRLGLTVITYNERATKLYKKLGFEVEREKVHLCQD